MKKYVSGTRVIDMAGERYGKLMVVNYVGLDKNNEALWQCICDCGKDKTVVSSSLRSGRNKSCGCAMSGRIDLVGNKYGKLVVEKYIGTGKNRDALWECECDCGNKTVTTSISLRLGKTRSCGCLKRLSLVGNRYGKLVVDKYLRMNKWHTAVWGCTCDCGVETEVISHNLVSGRVRSCGCLVGKMTENKIGKIYGRLKVISRNGAVNDFLCKCECGEMVVINGDDLSRGVMRSCGCGGLDISGGYEEALYALIAAYKSRAKKKKREFNLTYEELILLFTDTCYYCGDSPGNIWTTRNSMFIYNGLDRVDSMGGYTKGNVRTCCEICNTAKNDLSEKEFFEWIERVARYFKYLGET